MSATANATWNVRFMRSERPVASGLYPSSAAAARTRSTIAGLAPVPCSARDVEASETPARRATWIRVARDDDTVAPCGTGWYGRSGNVSRFDPRSPWKRFRGDGRHPGTALTRTSSAAARQGRDQRRDPDRPAQSRGGEQPGGEPRTRGDQP